MRSVIVFGLRPKRWFKLLALLIECERMERELVGAIEMRVKKSITADVSVQAHQRVSKGPDRIPHSDEFDVGRDAIDSYPALFQRE